MMHVAKCKIRIGNANMIWAVSENNWYFNDRLGILDNLINFFKLTDNLEMLDDFHYFHISYVPKLFDYPEVNHGWVITKYIDPRDWLTLKDANGKQVVLNPIQEADFFNNIRAGYTIGIPITGTVGASELGMHLGICNRKGIMAFKKDVNSSFAAVVLDDGSIHRGILHIFEDNTFSLS